jgi:Domain of unknown function (DUF3472)/Domain of unknown function (DUF5077)
MKKILTLGLVACLSSMAYGQACFNQEFSIPLAGNSFSQNEDADHNLYEDASIKNWKDAKITYQSYFKAESAGTAQAFVNIKHQGKSSCELKISSPTQQFVLKVSPGEKTYAIGTMKFDKVEYVKLNWQISKGQDAQLDIENLDLKSNNWAIKPSFVVNNVGRFFYWGRRGPSVHLQYQIPEKEQVEWFYNELQVPKTYDIEGTYAMANGFGEGYFGMQVNSATERRILFSIWSPFVTDNPKDIPEEERTKLLKKGPQVKTGEFGHEGSGGQSYLVYPWEAGKTYCFLNTAKPNTANGSTVYTAYFKAKTDSQWQLIASFERPKTNTYLTRCYSFLENFIMSTSEKPRQALYTNQWYRPAQGQWQEVNKARFAIDRTARMGFRKDHSCAVDNDFFVLKNCGFFSESKPLGTMLDRPAKNQAPEVDFEKLP